MEEHLWIAGADIFPVTAASSLMINLLNLQEQALIAWILVLVAATTVVASKLIVGTSLPGVHVGKLEVTGKAGAVFYLKNFSSRAKISWLNKQTIWSNFWLSYLTLWSFGVGIWLIFHNDGNAS